MQPSDWHHSNLRQTSMRFDNLTLQVAPSPPKATPEGRGAQRLGYPAGRTKQFSSTALPKDLSARIGTIRTCDKPA
jgi:hypothetical protein